MHQRQVVTMTTYETTATVESQGQIRVSGVPFRPGTRVDVMITPTQNGAQDPDRALRLLAALDKARNSESVGPLQRAELYDRDILHRRHILIYAASKAPPDQPKRQVARSLLARPDVGFSAQVLQEFYAVAVAKQRLQMTHHEAIAVLQSLAAFPVWPISRELVTEAVDARQRGKWDVRRCSARI